MTDYDVQGSIAGAVVVIIVVIALCALATFFLVRMRNRRRAQVLPPLLLLCQSRHRSRVFTEAVLQSAFALGFWCQRQPWSASGGLYGGGRQGALASTNISTASALLCEHILCDGRVLQMWRCSPTLTSRATASSRDMADTLDMGSSGRAMGSRVMVSRGMAGSLKAVHMEATSLPAIPHKVRAFRNRLLPASSSSTWQYPKTQSEI